MKGRIILLIAACFVQSGALADCNDIANQAREQGRVDEAIDLLNECVAEQLDRLARSWLLLGLAYYEKGEQDLAIANYTKAIEAHPDYAVAYTNRGLANALASNAEAAMADFEQALKLAPDYFKAYYFRAYTHHIGGNYEAAVADYASALEHAVNADEDTRALIYYRRGLALGHTSSREAALYDYDRAVELDPYMVEAWFSRGLFHQQADDYEQAISDYSRVIELEPDHTSAHYNRGRLYDRTDADHLAIKDYHKVLEVQPSSAKAQVNLARIRIIPLLPLLMVAVLG